MASEKITAIVEEIKALTILEVADLVKVLEAEFGVSAAPVAVAAVGGAAEAAPAAEEKTEFDVELTSFSPQEQRSKTRAKSIMKIRFIKFTENG